MLGTLDIDEMMLLIVTEVSVSMYVCVLWLLQNCFTLLTSLWTCMPPALYVRFACYVSYLLECFALDWFAFILCTATYILIFLCTATYRYFLQLEMHVRLICVIKLYLLTSNGWGQRHCFQVHCPSVNACLCTWMPRLSYSPVGLPSTIVFLSYFAFSIFLLLKVSQ